MMSTPQSITGWIIVTPAAVLSILFSFAAVIYYKSNLRSLDFFLLILFVSMLLDILVLVAMAMANVWSVTICTFYVVLWNVLRHGELFTLATMAVDRLLILRCHDKISHDVTMGKIIFITLAWILALFISALPFSDGSKEKSFNIIEEQCNFLASELHWNYGIFVGIFHIAIILPTVLTAVDVVVNLKYLKKEVMFSLEPEWNTEEMSTPVLNQNQRQTGRMRLLAGGLTRTRHLAGGLANSATFNPKRLESQRPPDYTSIRLGFAMNLMSHNLIRSTLLPVVNNNVLSVTSMEQIPPPSGRVIGEPPAEILTHDESRRQSNETSWGETREFHHDHDDVIPNLENSSGEPNNVNIEQLSRINLGRVRGSQVTSLQRSMSENNSRPPNALFRNRELPLGVNYPNGYIPPPPAGGVPAVLLGLPAGALAPNVVSQTHPRERFSPRQNSATCIAVAASLDNGRTCLLVLFCCICFNHLPYAIIVLIGVITNSSSATGREVAVWCLLVQALLVFIVLWLNVRYRTAYFNIRDFLVSRCSRCACDWFSKSENNEVCLNSYITTRDYITDIGAKGNPISLPAIAVSECSILPVHLWPRRSIQSMSSFRSGNMYRPPSAGSYYMDMEDKISVDLDSDSEWSNRNGSSVDHRESIHNENRSSTASPHPSTPDLSLKSSGSYASMIYKVE